MYRLSPRLTACTVALAVLGSGARAASAAGDGGATFGARPTAIQVLARVTAGDALLDSFTVPVHIDVHLHKLITLHFGMNGTEYFKRPDRLTLDLREMPAQYRRLFGEIGTPLTWPATYDMRTVGSTVADGHTTYRIEGTPRHAGAIKSVVLAVDDDATLPVHGTWTCTDGTTIDMTFEEEASGPYQLLKRALADVSVSGYRIHAVLDYGPYTFNAAVADSVFAQ